FAFKFGTDPKEHTEWIPLLPKLEHVAKAENETLRWEAVLRLKYYPEEAKFLNERIEAEDSASVLMALVYQSHLPETNERFCALLLKLLNSGDVQIQNRALLFIGSNPNSAPMWQISFNAPVVDRVLELVKAEADKSNAVFALNALS